MKSVWFGDSSAAESRLDPATRLGGHRSESTASSFTELQHASDESMGWGVRCYSKGGFVAQLDDNFISLMTEQVAVHQRSTATCT